MKELGKRFFVDHHFVSMADTIHTANHRIVES